MPQDPRQQAAEFESDLQELVQAISDLKSAGSTSDQDLQALHRDAQALIAKHRQLQGLLGQAAGPARKP